MFALHLFPLLALSLYTAASVLYMRSYLSSQAEFFVPRGVLSGAFLCHLLFLAPLLLSPVRLLPVLVSAVVFLLVGVFLLSERRWRIASLGAFVAPIALLSMLFVSAMAHVERQGPALYALDRIIMAHIVAALLAHAILLVSLVLSLAYLLQRYSLKRKRLLSFQRFLPPLQVLDQWNGSTVVLGFVFMVLGVGLGILSALFHRVNLVEGDPRLLWSFLVLGVYAALVMARFLRGVTGGRAAWLSIAAFGMNCLSLVTLQLTDRSFHVY